MPDKAAFEAKRGELAKQVWAQMKADDSATCRQCHTPGAMDLFAQSEKAAERHRAARDSGETCIDCHRGIAHFPPEFTEGANEAAKHLSELAAHTPTDAKALYPVARLPLYADKDKAVEIANILPTAAMQVTGADGSMRAVTISGYQQEGAAQVIYAQSGKRIISAIVAEEAIDRLQNGEYTTDTETGSQWRPVTLTAWVENANLLADAQPLWDYGNALNGAYCGGCHAVVPADHYTANQWPSIVNGMVSRTSMDDAGKLMLTYYLQNHAKDVKGDPK
ncbi:NapC/NirT family cytochrome c [Cardiobacterium hominis]